MKITIVMYRKTKENLNSHLFLTIGSLIHYLDTSLYQFLNILKLDRDKWNFKGASDSTKFLGWFEFNYILILISVSLYFLKPKCINFRG